MFGHAAINGKVRANRGCEALDLSFGADPACVAEARGAVARWAASHGAAGWDVDRIRLAVSEAVTNAVVHAYADERRGAVRVTAGLSASELTVLVADHGCGIGAAPESPGLGLGLGVIDESSDAFTIMTRAGGGMQLEMRFRLDRCGERRVRGPDAYALGSLDSAARGRGASDEMVSPAARGSVASAMRAAAPRFSTSR
jgi:serine/threonine-protein kinase RsbW/stage II sporulation protein AB (anti-sigma F factor)